MKAKHTPGPLGFKECFDRDSGLKLHRVVKGVSIVAECYGINSEANARLIASAPDLLAALENLLNAANQYQDLRDKNGVAIFNAHAAIAKAKGLDNV